MPVLKSSYKINPDNLNEVDPEFLKHEYMAGADEFSAFVDWGRMLRQLGYPCAMCDGSGRLEVFEQRGTYIPCAICAGLCPTCGKTWKGRAAWDAEGHATIPGGPMKEDESGTCC